MKQRDLGISRYAMLASVVTGCTGLRTAHDDLTAGSERVVAHGAWLDINEVPARYRTIADAPIAGPYYVLIAASGRYCPVDARTYTSVNDDHAFACAWRYPRP